MTERAISSHGLNEKLNCICGHCFQKRESIDYSPFNIFRKLMSIPENMEYRLGIKEKKIEKKVLNIYFTV